MLIVLEGPDCAGKTSLAERLVQELKSRDLLTVDVWHRGPPTQHPIDEYSKPLWPYATVGQDLILDRWHLGELVYPPVLGRPTKLDTPTLRYLELVLLARGALQVHVTQHTEVLETRMQARGDALVRVYQLKDVRRRFIQVIRYSTILDTWHVDASDHTDWLDALLTDAAAHEAQVWSLGRFRTYVGGPRPDLLLLGDVRGPKNGDPYAPAFVPYPSTSGHFLLKSIEAATTREPRIVSPRWRKLGIANACDVDSPGDLWQTLGQPRVVTLGTNAHRMLDGLGIPHVAAPHPQFVRRFHHKHELAYGRFLLEGTSLPWED